MKVGDLLAAGADNSLQIPPHQRPEIWDKKRKAALVSTVLAGLPMQQLIICESIDNGKQIDWLEDGQQRYWSLVRYTQGDFEAGEDGAKKFYSQLTPHELARFECYDVPVIKYKNATEAERLRMFDYLQNGVPLTSGQRFHAMQALSPMVRYAQETFMGSNERVAKIFGFGTKPLDDRKDKSKKHLQNAMAITGGIVLGIDFITTSYEALGPFLKSEIPENASIILDKLLGIYVAVQDHSAWPNTDLKKYLWPVGKITGYVLWSLLECTKAGGNMDALTVAWIDYLVLCRSDRKMLNLLHKDMPSSRNWTSERWRTGFENIFVGGPANTTFKEGVFDEAVPEIIESDDDED